MYNSKGDSDIISTDSDIGTSPSGTTLASQPSSPQQINQSADSPSYFGPNNNNNPYNFYMDNNENLRKRISNAQSRVSNESSMNDADRFYKDGSELFSSNLPIKQGYLDVSQLTGLNGEKKKQLGLFLISKVNCQ